MACTQLTPHTGETRPVACYIRTYSFYFAVTGTSILLSEWESRLLDSDKCYFAHHSLPLRQAVLISMANN